MKTIAQTIADAILRTILFILNAILGVINAAFDPVWQQRLNPPVARAAEWARGQLDHDDDTIDDAWEPAPETPEETARHELYRARALLRERGIDPDSVPDIRDTAAFEAGMRNAGLDPDRHRKVREMIVAQLGGPIDEPSAPVIR